MQQSLRLDEQVVVITGAGQGLGRAHALELARRGARVVVNDLGSSARGDGNDGGPAQRVVAEICAAGGTAIANGDSVATSAGGRAIVDAAVNEWGRIDAVVHNAGILRDVTFAKLEPADLDSVLAVHLLGAFYVMQPAFKRMKDQGGGRLVLTTSASGLFGNFGQSNYSAAKMGLVGLMRTLALEGARYNIKANALAPVAATRLTTGKDATDTGIMSPERIAPIIPILCAPECPSSGDIFQVGGGWFSRVLIAANQGWVAGEGELNAESILSNWDGIREGALFEIGSALEVGNVIARKLGLETLTFD
jgi:NAD(P)-dependent dehydrogenase (short-subunit alcohol dehydrogenase family)